MSTPWIARGTAGHETHGQWSVYEESGRDIAIVYDGAKHAQLIADAPCLLGGLKELELRTRQFIKGELVTFPAALLPQIRALIAHAGDTHYE